MVSPALRVEQRDTDRQHEHGARSHVLNSVEDLGRVRIVVLAQVHGRHEKQYDAKRKLDPHA